MHLTTPFLTTFTLAGLAKSAFLAAAAPNNTSAKQYLQATNNGGTLPYVYLVGGSFTKSQASYFGDFTSNRLITTVSGSLYQSLAPTENYLLNFTTNPTDASGKLSGSDLDGNLGPTFLVTGSETGGNFPDVWAVCPIPGEAGLVEVKLARQASSLTSGCTRVDIYIESR